MTSGRPSCKHPMDGRDNSNEKPCLWGFSDDPTEHHRKCGWSQGWPPCWLMHVIEALGARFVGQYLKTLIERTKGLVEWKYMLIYFVLIDSYTPIFFYVGWFIVKLLRFLGHWQAMSVGIMMAVSSTTANGYHWAATAAPFIIIIVLSPFLAPYLVSRRYGSMYLSNLLMNQSPRAFARVPVLTRVNDSKLATRSF